MMEPPDTPSSPWKHRLYLWGPPVAVILAALAWGVRTWHAGVGGIYFDLYSRSVLQVSDYGVGAYSLRALAPPNQPRSLVLARGDDGEFELFDERMSGYTAEKSLVLEATLRRNEWGGFDQLGADGSWRESWIRLESPEVIDLFRMMGVIPREEFAASLGSLTNTRQDGLIITLARADLALSDNNLAALERAITDLRSFSSDSRRPIAEDAVAHYEFQLEGIRLAHEGQNLYHQLRTPPADLRHMLDLLSTIDQDSVLITPDNSFMLIYGFQGLNWYHYSMTLNTILVLADFHLFAGEPSVALNLILKPLALGILLTRDGIGFDALIGTHFRNRCYGGLERVFLDGTWDGRQIAQLFPLLKRVYELDLEAAGKSGLLLERNVAMIQMRYGIEARTRLQSTHARIANLLTAAAARHALVLDPAHRPTPVGVGPLLPDGAPPDPFSGQGESIRVAAEDGGRFIAYSIGPDREDQGGLVTYDPTNGTISAGDITLEIRRDRRYPFPAPGTLPTTRNALLAAFPEGLPEDPFSSSKGSYIVTDDDPAWVLSLGPVGKNPTFSAVAGEARQRAARGRGISTDGELYRVHAPFDFPVHYDPTNGVTHSEGGIYFQTGEPRRTLLSPPLPPTPTPLPTPATVPSDE